MAATPKYQANSGIMELRTYPSFYSKLFDEVRKKTEETPKELDRFFSERNTNQETYKEGEVFNQLEVPARKSDTDRFELLQAPEGYNKTFTNVERGSAIMVTKRAVKAQKNKMLSQMITGLPESVANLQQLCQAKLFNDGFASETTGDGSYVFATDHYYADPAHGQYSNEAASGGTFTTSSYLAGWLNMQKRKNQKGFPSRLIPGELLYPPDIHEAVMKVHGSTLYPDTSLNAKMPELFGAFEPVMGHWLNSTTAWFIHAKGNENDKGFLWVWEIKPEYESISDSMNPRLIMGKSVTESFSYGTLHSRDWYANSGA